MSTGIRISDMTAGHLPDVLWIEMASFPDPWSRRSFLSELDNPHAECFVALAEKDLRGYACVRDVMGEGHIMKLAVHPAFRRGGIGRELALKAVDALRGRGCGLAQLEARMSNTPAIMLYESLGFRKAGTRKSYYPPSNEDALVMELEL